MKRKKDMTKNLKEEEKRGKIKSEAWSQEERNCSKTGNKLLGGNFSNNTGNN